MKPFEFQIETLSGLLCSPRVGFYAAWVVTVINGQFGHRTRFILN